MLQFLINIAAALGAGKGGTRVVCRVVIAGNVVQRPLKYRKQVFQVSIGQIAAPKDEVYIAKMAIGCQGIEAFDYLVANGKTFHGSMILPQNCPACKCGIYLDNVTLSRYLLRFVWQNTWKQSPDPRLPIGKG